jgi:outer membrane protein OmpA-like peptidoglycan-associated protein
MSTLSFDSRVRRCGVALLLGALAGCGSFAPSMPGAPVSTRQALAGEHERLSELFRGTPVVVSLLADGRLQVEVPTAFSFDPGRYTVKPPLGAVLRQLARGQRGLPTRLLVVGPSDADSRSLRLATERANSMRDYLVGQGVAATRFSISAVERDDGVRIVVKEAAAQ